MGVVYLARRGGGERVALKLLRPHIAGDQETRARLAREVGSLSRVRSRWVAEIIDADPWGPEPYIATRYVPGLSLHEQVAEDGPVSGRDLMWLARCLAEGISAVHAAGVLHRDVKPSNVLMEGRTPILIDFGLARVAEDPKLTQTGWLLGTPGYLAPEILYGEEPTPAMDVHAWAATVAFAATGRPPFGRGPSMAIMDRARRGQHDLSGVPEQLLPLLAAALEPDPLTRPTLEAIIGWLRAESEPGSTQRRLPPPPPAPPPVAPVTRRLPEGDPFELPISLFDDAPTTDRVPVAPVHIAPEPRRPAGAAEVLRRGTLLLVMGTAVVAGLTAYPWIGLTLLVTAVWLLRSASLAASSVRVRREVRGRRWYDAPVMVVRTPWDLLRSVPGTVVLTLWAGGLAVAAALLAYAFAAPLSVGIAVTAAVLVGAMWWGPGGHRVRGPVGGVVRPLARSVRAWLIALVVVTTGAAALGYLAAGGTDWAPSSGAPLQSLFR